MDTSITVVNGDITETACDLLVLKHAQRLYGADAAVARVLEMDPAEPVLAPGEHLLVPTKGKLRCDRVLFIGVESLYQFGYSEIRAFAKKALSLLTEFDDSPQTIAMTIHGVRYGLDEREAFTAQVAGLLEYLASSSVPSPTRRILIVERDTKRAQRLSEMLREILLESGFSKEDPRTESGKAGLPDAGVTSDMKHHIFVAMSFNEEMEDIYEFGIREPVNSAGCLCERCDRDVYIGDVLERIKGRIASATVVLAEMTGANPNVYLEVGYAWGKGVPTLLVARKGQELLFDVSRHRCLYYRNIKHLRKQLADELPKLLSGSRQRSEASLSVELRDKAD